MKITNLNKKFDNVTVFDNFSVEFIKGINLISGESGRGKTTLLRIISGLEKYDSGYIDDFGKISYVFQESRLLPWFNTLTNVSIKEREKGLGLRIVSELGVDDKLYEFPEKLSGGMQRRAALARALSADFDTLLLDEPFTGLDEANITNAIEVIRRYTNNKCVIIVSHTTEFEEECVNRIKI